MNSYFIAKWLHIVSSVVLVGTGFGSAFYMFFVNRSDSVAATAIVSRLVVRADWWFTTPAVIVQPATGLWLLSLTGWPLTTPWVYASILLYVFAGACWIPVVFIQQRMAKLAAAALNDGVPLPPEYHSLRRRWELLGYPAFLAMLVIYWLMVSKPQEFG
jgi:uncharacterized membrane protein